jgi:hypothetical protein
LARPKYLGITGQLLVYLTVKIRENRLVSFRSWHFLAVVVKHGDVPSVVGTSETDDLVLPMPLFAQQFVDLIVQVAHLVVGQTG